MITVITEIEHAKDFVANKLAGEIGSNEFEVSKLEKEQVATFYTNHPRGAVLIHYDGSAFSESLSSSVIYQNRLMRVAIFIQVRIEHGYKVKDELVDRIINLLSGLKFKSISKTGRIRMREDQIIVPEDEKGKGYLEHSIVVLIPAEFKQTQENI